MESKLSLQEGPRVFGLFVHGTLPSTQLAFKSLTTKSEAPVKNIAVASNKFGNSSYKIGELCSFVVFADTTVIKHFASLYVQKRVFLKYVYTL